MAEEYSVSLKVDSKDAVQGLNEANKAVNALDKEFQDLVQEMNGDADKAFESIQNKMLALAQAGKRGTEEYKKYAEMLGRVNQATNVVDKDIENFSASVNDVSANISVMEDRLYELAVQGKQDSEEFKNLVKQVGNLKRAVVETDMVIERAAATNMDLGQQVGLLEDQLYQLAIEGKQNTEEFKKLAEEAGKLKGKIAEADIAVEEYAITNADLGQKVGILTNKMYRLAEAGQMNSKEFMETAQAAAAAQQQLNRVDMVMEAMSMTGAMRLQTAMGGVQGAFDFANGAMQLFGVESVEAQKAMMKFQAALQMVTAITTIQQAIPAMTALKNTVVTGFQSMTQSSKAFLMAGIGLILVGLISLYENWEKIKLALSGVTKAQKLYNEASMKAIDSISKELNAADKLSDQLNDEKISRGEKLKLIKAFQKEYPGLLRNVNLEKMSISEINKQLIQNIELLKLQAKAKAIQTMREENYKKILEKQIELESGRAQAEYSFLGIEIGSIRTFSDAKNGIIEFSSAYDSAAADTKKAKKSIEKDIKILDEQDKAIQKQIASLQKRGAVANEKSQEEIEAEERKAAAIEEANQRAAQAAQAAADARKAALEEINDALNNFKEQQLLSTKNDQQKEIYEVEKKYAELLKSGKKYKYKVAELETAMQKEIKDIKDKYEKIAEEERKKKAEEELAAYNEQLAKKYELEDQQFMKLQELKLSQNDLERFQLQVKFDEDLKMAADNAELKKALEEKYLKDLAAITKRENDAIAAENKARDEKELERKRKLEELRVQAVSDSLNIISNLSQIFAGKSVEQQKKAFKIQKGVQIAQAIMDTYKAANAALASSPPPFNFIAAGAAITAGLLNVKKIADQKFEAATSGGGGGGSTSGGVTAPVQSPEFNIVGNANVNALSQFANTPIQTYVVSGDVTTAQALDRNRISNATL